jgi:hypothetical protein
MNYIIKKINQIRQLNMSKYLNKCPYGYHEKGAGVACSKCDKFNNKSTTENLSIGTSRYGQHSVKVAKRERYSDGGPTDFNDSVLIPGNCPVVWSLFEFNHTEKIGGLQFICHISIPKRIFEIYVKCISRDTMNAPYPIVKTAMDHNSRIFDCEYPKVREKTLETGETHILFKKHESSSTGIVSMMCFLCCFFKYDARSFSINGERPLAQYVGSIPDGLLYKKRDPEHFRESVKYAIDNKLTDPKIYEYLTNNNSFHQ